MCCFGSIRNPLFLINSWIFRKLLFQYGDKYPLPSCEPYGKSDYLQLSLSLKYGSPMFCKSGILIFIFAENNYSIYAHPMLIKTPLLHQSFCSRVFLSLSLSLSLSGYFFGAQRLSEFTFLPGLLRPSQEGALGLHPIKRVPEASVNRASPGPGALLAFCVNQGISTSFSLFSFQLTPDHQVPVH